MTVIEAIRAIAKNPATGARLMEAFSRRHIGYVWTQSDHDFVGGIFAAMHLDEMQASASERESMENWIANAVGAGLTTPLPGEGEEVTQ